MLELTFMFAARTHTEGDKWNQHSFNLHGSFRVRAANKTVSCSIRQVMQPRCSVATLEAFKMRQSIAAKHTVLLHMRHP